MKALSVRKRKLYNQWFS